MMARQWDNQSGCLGIILWSDVSGGIIWRLNQLILVSLVWVDVGGLRLYFEADKRRAQYGDIGWRIPGVLKPTVVQYIGFTEHNGVGSSMCLLYWSVMQYLVCCVVNKYGDQLKCIDYHPITYHLGDKWYGDHLVIESNHTGKGIVEGTWPHQRVDCQDVGNVIVEN